MESRPRASPEQFLALLEFMESHGDIARPQQGPQGRVKADRFWQELTDLLNGIGGGVERTVDKWKKVWADWKAKTKKKALTIHREASRTGGGPRSKLTLTASEKKVLAIMGFCSVVGQDCIEESGFMELPVERNPPVQMDEIFLQTLTENIEDTSSSQVPPPDTARSPPLPMCSIIQTSPSPIPSTSEATRQHTVPSPIPSTSHGFYQQPAHSPIPSTSHASHDHTARSLGASTRRRTRPSSPLLVASPRRRMRLGSPALSPTASTPQRQRLIRQRTRRLQTPFERATSEFVAVENRRLQLEEERERNHHQREMERLRLESRRIEIQHNQNLILGQLAQVLGNLTEILPQLRPSSLASTDILPSNP